MIDPDVHEHRFTQLNGNGSTPIYERLFQDVHYTREMILPSTDVRGVAKFNRIKINSHGYPVASIPTRPFFIYVKRLKELFPPTIVQAQVIAGDFTIGDGIKALIEIIVI